MFKSRSEAVIASTCLLLTGAGCELDAPEFRFGVQLTGLQFELFSEDAGIHPSDDILADPNNPFVESGVGDTAKFDILAEGGNVATYYAWGTLLANGPNGENQFYTAVGLEGIYEVGEASDEELPIVREMAIRAYQSVLDNFPDSVTFSANGVQRFRLATPAYLAIVRLGGIPEGDWVLVTTPDGGQEAVQGASPIGGGS